MAPTIAVISSTSMMGKGVDGMLIGVSKIYDKTKVPFSAYFAFSLSVQA